MRNSNANAGVDQLDQGKLAGKVSYLPDKITLPLKWAQILQNLPAGSDFVCPLGLRGCQ